MYNDWITIGGFTIHGYGVMIALGILAAIWITEKLAVKHGLKKDVIVDLVLWSVIIGFMGSKLLYVIVEWEAFLKDPWAVLGTDGFVVFGGLTVGILTAATFCKIKKLKFFDYFNLCAPGIALAQAFGRIGCFCAGCCYGKVTNSFIGVTFPATSLAPSSVPLIPTQIISSIGDFALFVILYKLYNSKSQHNTACAWYLMLYSVGRFLVEMLRDDPRGSFGIFSTSQFYSFFSFAAGLALYFYLRKKKEDQVSL